MKSYRLGFGALIICAGLAGIAPFATAQGNSNGNGNASDGIMGMIITDKRIYYTGDSLEIGLRFPKGSDLITSGEVDANVVIFTPGDTAPPIVLPVSGEASASLRKLFEMEAVDISALPAGQYQLGLVLTVPDGDPLEVTEWHNGLLGLINVVGIRIASEAQEDDGDGDGMVDNDDDGDGFADVIDDTDDINDINDIDDIDDVDGID